jgi:hypothetical protein
MNGRSDQASPALHPETGQLRGDEEIAARIRALAAGWQMPGGAEDVRSWRDRAQRTDARRRGWRGFGRALTAAAVIAIALTVVAAGFVVWLRLPGQKGPTSGVTVSPPTTSARPRPTIDPRTLYSAPPTTTPNPTLPAYALTGAPLSAEQVIVDAGSGPALFNIATGQLSSETPTTGLPYAQLFALPDGSFLCACATTQRALDTSGTEMQSTELTLRWLSADGSAGRTITLPTYVGRADPGVGSEGDHAVVTASLGPGATTLEVGWAIEAPPSWRSGIDVVDLATGQVVETVSLPTAEDHAGTVSAGVSPPSLTFAPDGRLAMIERFGWPGVAGADQGSWHATATFSSGRLGSPVPVASGASGLDGTATCSAFDGPAGFAPGSTSYYTICTDANGSLLRRVDRSGRRLGDTRLTETLSATAGLGVVVDEARDLLYAWDPFAKSLLRVDLQSGKVTGNGTLPVAAASNDPLANAARALARWLAPSVEAKVYLSPSLVLSADGSRLYAIGTAATDPLTPAGGSTGVWVFDSTTLGVVDHWAPDADYVSLGFNHDGSLLLAAGMPGSDATGTQSDQGASVTIYDAATGAIKAVAGEVGTAVGGWLTFPVTP